jgi:hypothetical protein
MNLVHTFDHACLEHINALCTWCSITDYPRVVTSMREGRVKLRALLPFIDWIGLFLLGGYIFK